MDPQAAEKTGYSTEVVYAAETSVGRWIGLTGYQEAENPPHRIAHLAGAEALGRKANDYLLYQLYARDVKIGKKALQTAEKAVAAERAAQVALLRDVFNNPFRPVDANPEWLTSTVVALAEGIYQDRAFDRLPILADALQDAGCDNEDVLNHCRSEGPHVRGCWVVDLVLGKS